MAKVDLHIHSNYSDGSDSVQELINKLLRNNIEIFALTDHDTTEGCMEIQKFIPQKIKFISGVELTSESEGLECHILGYGCDPYNTDLLSLIKKGKKLRQQKLETRIEYLKKVWNIDLTENELNWLYSRKSVVKTHVAHILVQRGLAKNNVSAMNKYLDGCKTGQTRFSIEESINAIKSSGGIPVYAHSIGGEGEKHITKKELLPKLKKMIKYGIEGLECYYSRYSLEEIEFLQELANKNNLFITGGSDYHGTNKDIPIAKLNTENKYIDSEKLNILKVL